LKNKRRDSFCRNTIQKIKAKSKDFKSSIFTLIDGVLHFQKKIIVPSSLKASILYSFYDKPPTVTRELTKLSKNLSILLVAKHEE